MRRIRSEAVGVFALAWFLTAGLSAKAQQPVAMRVPAPELQGVQEWINGEPTRWKDLKGKVVVVHFWAFG